MYIIISRTLRGWVIDAYLDSDNIFEIFTDEYLKNVSNKYTKDAPKKIALFLWKIHRLCFVLFWDENVHIFYNIFFWIHVLWLVPALS